MNFNIQQLGNEDEIDVSIHASETDLRNINYVVNSRLLAKGVNRRIKDVRMDWPVALTKGNNEGFVARTELDTEGNYLRVIRYNVPIANYEDLNFHRAVVTRSSRITKDMYFSAMDTIEDPVKYLEYLGLYKGAGVCLHKKITLWDANKAGIAIGSDTVKGPFWVDSVSSISAQAPIPKYVYFADASGRTGKLNRLTGRYSGSMTPPRFDYTGVTFERELPAFASDGAKYIRALYNFRETLITKYLKDTFLLLDAARLEDLPVLWDTYSSKLNRAINAIPAMIRKKHIIYTWYKGRKLSKTFTSRIPYSTHAVKVPVTLPSDEIIYMTPVKYLMEVYNEALRLYRMNLPKVESRIAQLRSGKTLPSTEWTADPFSNPFLVYDPKKSQAQDKPVYTNVAKSPAKSQVVDVVYEAGPQIIDYINAGKIRDMTARNIRTSDGSLISAKDYLEMTGRGTATGSVVPWVIGGVAIAAIATQV